MNEGEVGPYNDSITARHGSNPIHFRDAVYRRLDRWGFNGLGAWATEEFYNDLFPYTVIVEFYNGMPRIPPDPERKHGLADLFDPLWEEGVEKKAAEVCARHRNAKMLLGYFTDNEKSFKSLHTFERHVEPSKHPNATVQVSLLQLVMSYPGTAGYMYAWQWVLERHGSLEALSQAWELSVKSKEDVGNLTADGLAIVSKGYMKDQDDFEFIWASRYFNSTSSALRRHDPNHLVIGNKVSLLIV